MADTTQNGDLQAREKRPMAAPEATRPGRYFEPAVDIYETEAALTLDADMPGVAAGDVQVDVKDGVLTISGQVPALEAQWKRAFREYEVGHFHRQFRLGEKIDQGRISAEVRNGVLHLVLPKVERAVARRIEVRTVE